MLPAAFVAKAVGTAWGLVITRVLTMCADVAAVPLVGLLVRQRGPLATLLACGILAVYPDGIFAAHTLLLEPWLNLFCLLGALAMFDGDRLGVRPVGPARRGVLRVRGHHQAVGVGACDDRRGVVPAAPAPGRRVRLPGSPRPIAATVAAVRHGGPRRLPAGRDREPVHARGDGAEDGAAAAGQPERPVRHIRHHFGGPAVPASAWTVVGGSVAICVFVLVTYACASLVRRRPPAPLDLYALLGAAAVIAMFMWPAEFYAHYAAFFGPFLALVVSLPAGWLTGHRWLAEGGRTWLPRLAAAAAVALIGIMAVTQAGVEEDTVPAADPAAIADRIIPPGACVVSDTVSLTVVANRFVSAAAGCPLLVDSFGTLMADTGGRNMNAGHRILRGIAGTWRSWFMRARFVWLDGATFGRIPWDSALTRYFTSRFRRILPYGTAGGPGASGGLYVRIGGAGHAHAGPPRRLVVVAWPRE